MRAVCGVWLPPAGGDVVAPFAVDLNRASLGELQALPGVGPARARAIVLHRVRHGWLRSIDDLEVVDGFGPGTAAALAPFVVFGRPRSARD